MFNFLSVGFVPRCLGNTSLSRVDQIDIIRSVGHFQRSLDTALTTIMPDVPLHDDKGTAS